MSSKIGKCITFRLSFRFFLSLFLSHAMHFFSIYSYLQLWRYSFTTKLQPYDPCGSNRKVYLKFWRAILVPPMQVCKKLYTCYYHLIFSFAYILINLYISNLAIFFVTNSEEDKELTSLFNVPVFWTDLLKYVWTTCVTS